MKHTIALTLILVLTVFGQARALQAQVILSPETKQHQQDERGWQRVYGVSFAPTHSTKIKLSIRRWADLAEIKKEPNQSDYGWVEYFPKYGKPIWCVLEGGYGIIGGTTDSPMNKEYLDQVQIDPDSFSRDAYFTIPIDADGKGYRLWNRERTRMVGEQFFPDEDLSKLMVSLEPSSDNSFVIHAVYPGGLADQFCVQYSLNGKLWSTYLLVRNHELPITWDRRLSPHFPVEILNHNPHPWVEVDVFINLVHIRRRFRYGLNEPPIINPPPRAPHEPTNREAVERGRKWTESQGREKAKAAAHGKEWLPKPFPWASELTWDNNK